MRSALHAWVLAALCVLSPPTRADKKNMEMWSCAPPGSHRSVLYLADWGTRSYIKIQGQRVPATLSMKGTDRRWQWNEGADAVIMAEDGRAQYFQGGDMKNVAGTFECKQMR